MEKFPSFSLKISKEDSYLFGNLGSFSFRSIQKISENWPNRKVFVKNGVILL